MTTIELPFKARKPMLACGADMKGAFAYAIGKLLYLEEGFGDLSDVNSLSRYERAIGKAGKRLGVKPEMIVCDKHPGYSSTAFAERFCRENKGAKICRVQHHEAHIASGIMDNGIKCDVIGVAFDGTGYGSDGNIWGGEFFAGDAKAMRRVGHLEYIPMPGGEAAIEEPWRMAAGYLNSAVGEDYIKLKIRLIRNIDRKSWKIVNRMIVKRLNSPLSSSAGRLFDAVGSIVLGKEKVSFEAELPMELEKAALELCLERYEYDTKISGGIFIISMSKTIKGIIKDMLEKPDVSIISSRFHNTVASMISSVCGKLRKLRKIDNVVLSGGVFQNAYLINRVTGLLMQSGFRVYSHKYLKTNDSGIPAGQVLIANSRDTCV